MRFNERQGTAVVDKSKVCFIAATLKGDYCFGGIEQLGYRILIPYRDYNLFMRCMREAWFRLKLPVKHLWYNPQCARVEAELFIVQESLISPDFLRWMRKKHPNARIILNYDNMAGKTLNPNSITDPSIEKYTYDQGDAEKYGMKLTRCGCYYDSWVCPKNEPPVYDVVYVGRDKGRAEKMLELEKELQEQGLKTYFHICADRRFMRWKKSFYKPLLTYAQYLELLGKTKAVLNIVQDGAISITMREIEGAFHNVKCISNNPILRQWDKYHPSRCFVLGEDTIETLPAFLNSPFVPITEEQRDSMRYASSVEAMYMDGKMSQEN